MERLLAHASSDPRTVAESLPDGTRWAFLCGDYVRYRAWQDALGPGERVSDLMAAAQRELRRPFLDAITELGRRNASLGWWTSRLSERNPQVSPLFERCCHLKVATELERRVDGPLLIVSDSVAVLAMSGEYWVGHPPRGRRAERSGRAAWRALRFALEGLGRKPGLGRPAPGRCVAIRTWLDDSCFGDDGSFRDRYFPGLAEWFEQRGHRVVTLPVFVNVTRRDAWHWLRDHPREFVAPGDFIGLRDRMLALRAHARQARRRLGHVAVAGLDVTALFEEERLRVRFDRGSLEAAAWSRVPGHLARAGLDIEVLVHEYENMIDEKALILGARAGSPGTKLVGFQHSALAPALLCIYVTPGEAEFAPLADRVVCNGPLFRDILVREGMPADRAVVGRALRYPHLLHASPTAARGRDVLLLLPLTVDAAAELLNKCFTAFEGLDARVLVKRHPMSNRAALLAAAGADALPAGWEWVDGGMAAVLARAGVAVSLASASLQEALAAGVPVVPVGRDAALTINPLAWYDDLGRPVYEPDALRERVDELMALDGDEYAAYRRRADEVLEESFADGPMEAFLPE